MKKLMRVFSLLFVCLSLFVSLCSCQKSGTELADLMIIQGIGIDYENGSFNVTVEILNNEQSGSPNGNSSSENKTKLYSAKGKSVSDALRLLTAQSGNLPLFAHNRVIVINEKLNEKTIADVLEFFVRNYDSRASQLLCIAKGKNAEEIIRARLLKDTVKSEILENLLEESYQQSLIPRVRVIDAVNALNNNNAVLCIPAVTVKQNGENEDYQLDGCALYDEGGRVAGFINNDVAKGIAFLTDNVKQGFLTQRLPNGEELTVFISKSKTRYNVSTQNGRFFYHLTVDISCDIDEIGERERAKNDKQIMADLKETIRKAVVERMSQTLNAVQTQQIGDCIGYCRVLELKMPEAYNSVKGDWKNTFNTIQTGVTVNVTIRRIGEETLHIAKSMNEIYHLFY